MNFNSACPPLAERNTGYTRTTPICQVLSTGDVVLSLQRSHLRLETIWAPGTCWQTHLARASQMCLIGNMSGQYTGQFRSEDHPVQGCPTITRQCAGRQYLVARSHDGVQQSARQLVSGLHLNNVAHSGCHHYNEICVLYITNACSHHHRAHS